MNKLFAPALLALVPFFSYTMPPDITTSDFMMMPDQDMIDNQLNISHATNVIYTWELINHVSKTHESYALRNAAHRAKIQFMKAARQYGLMERKQDSQLNICIPRTQLISLASCIADMVPTTDFKNQGSIELEQWSHQALKHIVQRSNHYITQGLPTQVSFDAMNECTASLITLLNKHSEIIYETNPA